MNFTELIDLAAERVGGRALSASDEFFARKENLLKPGRGIFIEGKYTSRGKWMDGWETRRRRGPGHDWCLIRLGMRGMIRGLDVDSNHFIGNAPEHCSLQALDAPGNAQAVRDSERWTEILAKTPLQPGSQNLLAVRSLRPWTHVRLNIYPDGGVARLRVYGDVIPDWERLARSKKPFDLAGVQNGGLVLASSDMFFGSRNNLIMPGKARNMGEGWETKRRRGPGFDWCLIKLGTSGLVESIEVDTSHFKGNYPESCSLEGCYAPGALPEALASSDTAWVEVLPRTKLGPHQRHFFQEGLKASQPFTHVRLNIFPDGGVSRLRVYGRPAKAQPAP